MQLKTTVYALIGLFLTQYAWGQELQLSAPLKAKAYELLRYQCGAAEVESDFVDQFDVIGGVVKPLLVEVLTQGAPAEVIKLSRERAQSRYQRRQQWLTENGTELFTGRKDGTLDRIRSDYVENHVEKVNALFIENAVRGLGVVGDENSIKALQAFLQTNSDLKILVGQAVQRIKDRLAVE